VAIFDFESMCEVSGIAKQCLSFNQPLALEFADKQTSLEGIREGEASVRVRLMREISGKKGARPLQTGDLFLSWPSAVKLLETCSVSKAEQAHSLDVTLHLTDGREVRTLEPSIDEIIRIAKRVEGLCGPLSIITR
jgi:hypothetical protein